MAMSLRESVHLVSDPENLDASVEEVFRLMLGVDCKRQAEARKLEESPDAESVTAVVGFGGAMSGACFLRCSAETAMKFVAQMTGMEFEALDDTVQDGLGEICNMLAGAWKGKVPKLNAHCSLSVPTVIAGRDYNLHVHKPEFEMSHIYSYEEDHFSVTIVCDGIQ